MLKHFIDEEGPFYTLLSESWHSYGYSETQPTIIFTSSYSRDDSEFDQAKMIASDVQESSTVLISLKHVDTGSIPTTTVLIEEIIPEGDVHRIHYIELLDILELVFAQVACPNNNTCISTGSNKGLFNPVSVSLPNSFHHSQNLTF